MPADSHGSGLHAHQLSALALVATMGGVARLVWSNGGEIGVLDNGGILLAHAVYGAATRGTAVATGARSIKWEQFSQVPTVEVLDGVQLLDWIGTEVAEIRG